MANDVDVEDTIVNDSFYRKDIHLLNDRALGTYNQPLQTKKWYHSGDEEHAINVLRRCAA